MLNRSLLLGLVAVLATAVWSWRTSSLPYTPSPQPTVFAVQLSDQQWQSKLSPNAYRILRQEHTEQPYESILNAENRQGEFRCAGCRNVVFLSRDKYDSGTGWPSFSLPARSNSLGTKLDHKLKVARKEVHCADCGGHLGHVFADGPAPEGTRYCINGGALEFEPRDKKTGDLATGAKPVSR
jgi:peptide-methionine (R)-S-oxide reductase